MWGGWRVGGLEGWRVEDRRAGPSWRFSSSAPSLPRVCVDALRCARGWGAAQIGWGGLHKCGSWPWGRKTVVQTRDASLSAPGNGASPHSPPAWPRRALFKPGERDGGSLASERGKEEYGGNMRRECGRKGSCWERRGDPPGGMMGLRGGGWDGGWAVAHRRADRDHCEAVATFQPDSPSHPFYLFLEKI